jgi:dTDP-glucose 4,6-dehydratase
MEKIVVTGGCGFIGSNFIRMILEKEPTVEVINFDLLTYAGNLANLKDLEKNPRLKFFKGDKNKSNGWSIPLRLIQNSKLH